MKPHEVVKSLEDDAVKLEELCGEILATLTVNMNMNRIYFTTTYAREMFLEMMDKWWTQYQRLRTPVEKCDVTFSERAKESEAKEGKT